MTITPERCQIYLAYKRGSVAQQSATGVLVNSMSDAKLYIFQLHEVIKEKQGDRVTYVCDCKDFYHSVHCSHAIAVMVYDKVVTFQQLFARLKVRNCAGRVANRKKALEREETDPMCIAPNQWIKQSVYCPINHIGLVTGYSGISKKWQITYYPKSSHQMGVQVEVDSKQLTELLDNLKNMQNRAMAQNR